MEPFIWHKKDPIGMEIGHSSSWSLHHTVQMSQKAFKKVKFRRGKNPPWAHFYVRPNRCKLSLCSILRSPVGRKALSFLISVSSFDGDHAETRDLQKREMPLKNPLDTRFDHIFYVLQKISFLEPAWRVLKPCKLGTSCLQQGIRSL